MPAISHLNPTWEHTLTDILNHDPKTQMGIIMRAWVKDNNMTDFTSMLTYTADKFTPTGFLCYYKEKVDAETPTMMPTNLLQELYNLRRYITMNLIMIQMILILIILSVNIIGYPKQEENHEICCLYSIRWYRVKTNT